MSRWLCAPLVLALLAVSCSAEVVLPEPVAIDIANATLSSPVTYQSEDRVIVLPTITSAVQWVERSSDQLCGVVVQVELVRTCVEIDMHVDENSLSWSQDGDTLYFTEDYARFLLEPDIWAFSLSTSELRNLTDDRSSDIRDADAQMDQTPFENAAGELHFFRSSAAGEDETGSAQLVKLTVDGGEVEFPEIDLRVDRVYTQIFPLGKDRFLYGSRPTNSPDQVLYLLDLGASSVSEIDVSALVQPIILASGNDAAVVADLKELQFLRGGLFYFDVTQDRLEPLDALIGDEAPSFTVALSPTRRGVLNVGTRDVRDRLFDLSGLTVSADGELSAPLPLAPTGFLGTTADGDDREPDIVSSTYRFGWTRNNRLIIPTLDDTVQVFTLESE